MTPRNTDRNLIFLIEDSIDIRELVSMLFEGEGYTVQTASDGREALYKLSQLESLPGLVLLDLMMPVMDGYQFRKAQLADPTIANLPVIIITADSNPETKAQTLGAQGFLKKPVDLGALLKIAEKFCSDKRNA